MDEADVANDRLEKILEGQIQEAAHRASKQVPATGYCLNCDEPLQPFKRWCDAECCADWSKRNER